MSTALLQKVREYDIYYELLLRDKAGPLMQVLFHKMEQPMPKLSEGQVVRVVGQPLAQIPASRLSPCERQKWPSSRKGTCS
jgi:hypothetical protein